MPENIKLSEENLETVKFKTTLSLTPFDNKHF